MLKLNLALLCLALFLGQSVITLPAAETKPADPKPATPVDPKPTSTPTVTPYKVSETAPFIALAKEALAALSAGKQTEMVAKLTDLESAWDEKEKEMRPRNEAVWVSIDKTLDKAIAALRGSKVNLTKGKASLEALIKELAAFSKD
jgi:kynureninase